MTSSLGLFPITMTILIFLIRLVFDFYITVLILRFLLQRARASRYNPIFRRISQMTDPVLLPLRRITSGDKGVNITLIALILILGIIKSFLILRLQLSAFPNWAGVGITAAAQIAAQWLDIYLFALLIQAVISWFSALQRGAFAEVVFLIAAPIMRPIQRIIPSRVGIDFSPLIALVAMKLVSSFLLAPMLIWGMRASLA